MDDNVQNANPTILNASDLPSRRRESNVKQRGIGLSESFHFAYPFDALESSISVSDSDDDDVSVEAIDEQEIYGMLTFFAVILGSSDNRRFDIHDIGSGTSTFSRLSSCHKPTGHSRHPAFLTQVTS